MSNLKLRQVDIRYFAVAVSLIISFVSRIFPSTLNDDSYVYIRTAEIFIDQGAQAALNHYSWPVFSILIALVSKTGLTTISSAFLLNSLFFALLTFVFISIVKVIDSNRKTLVIAAACILVFPEVNEYRSMIIRDIAYWSLVLFSLWQLLLYTKNQQIIHSIAFTASLILATVFRVEALAYLVVIPLMHITFASSEFLRKSYLKLFLSNIAILISLTILLLIADVNVVAQVVEFVSRYRPFLDNLLNSNPEHAAALSVEIFGDHAATFSDGYLGLFIASGLFSILTAKLITGIGAPLVLLGSAVATKQKIKVERCFLLPLGSYLFVNFVIVCVFIFVTRYLPTRHTMIFSLVVLILIALVTKKLLDYAEKSKLSLLRGGIYFLLIYCTVDANFSFGKSKNYVANAVAWIDQNSPASQPMLTNNHALAYGSGKVENYDQMPRNLSAEEILMAGEGTLLAIEMNLTMTLLVNELTALGAIELEASFPSGEKPRMTIYRTVEH